MMCFRQPALTLPRLSLAAVLAAMLAAVLALTACAGPRRAADTGAPSPTPYIVYVTPTPEGFEPEASATPTPYVVYVTATPEGVAPPGEVTPTPFVIYITATPPAVGPYHATPGAGPPAVQPTLDLSGAPLVPTPRPTQAGEQPTITPAVPAATPTPTATPEPLITQVREGALYSNRLGINFISSAQHEADDERFSVGIDSGAGWDRFAIYWHEIEQEPDRYNWGVYDKTVRNDVISGLRTNAILLGTPGIYAEPNWIPRNLYAPIFADGTDIPGRGKALNPDNYWAKFVFNAVSRYRPGGVLARREGWPQGAGVRVWEIWNEPDFRLFWQGSSVDYARLLKVAAIAARQADPDARIMVGGLVLFEQPGFLIDLLNLYRSDPELVDQRYPFDIVAVHAYSHPSDSFYAVQWVETLLAVYGLNNVPVWVNESGVAVWNDYPGPTWATRRDQIIWRATLDEQAAYVIQNATFAYMAGASKLFHFQLYDDCGNQPAGTTFPPHDGSLCASQANCWGDALGLMRNERSNLCFNQHPEPGTPRPAYAAFHVVGEVFGAGDLIPLTGYPAGGRQFMIFARGDTGEIITVVWDESGAAGDVTLAARAGQAALIRMDGSRETIQPVDGSYRIALQPATNRNGTPPFMIGGPPVIVIEDSLRPIVTVLPLLDASQTAALVKWRSSSPEVVRYEIYYRDDTSGQNEWVRWIETEAPGEALFAAGIGRAYSFFARGQLPDGSWTADLPFPQAWTTLK